MKKFISVILLSACVASSAFAKEHGDRNRDHRGDGPMPLHKLVKVLDLSEAQIEQFKLLKQESKEGRSQKNRDDSVMMKLADLDPNANDYADSLSQLADARAEQARARFLVMAERRAKMQEILTPEQLDKLKLMQEKREKRGKKQKERQSES
ncbi:Spy/CpxP family protein refolding chaperone [Paraglaciecola sp.]|uniref:Spy/CpxP family protein refolding chaperone n=1 Tax=Paraglaciecola sp. TaxID=1920173 RepID=UPI00273D6AD1|nr:Spy/CpxP family protein refolding chaperone [Paraglaciecola sp.]MDP5029165.1 Spy/CpxP family protein refolding chaperone [Paraglaciecola sp.]